MSSGAGQTLGSLGHYNTESLRGLLKKSYGVLEFVRVGWLTGGRRDAASITIRKI
jgi:hypothetical protein